MHGHQQEPAPSAAPAVAQGGHHAGMEQEFRTRFLVTALLTIPVLFLSEMIQQWLGIAVTFPGAKYLLWALASVIVLWGGWPFFRGAARALPTGTLDMNVLVAVAIGAGYLFSTAATFLLTAPEFYWEISTLVVVLLFGHWMEMRSLRTATGALNALGQLIPPEAHRLTGGREETVPTADLQRGDLLLVRPGEQVPIDGQVIDGESEVNEALVTGESTPVRKTPGDRVIGGTLNGQGAFRMRVLAVGHDTAIARIMALISAAQASKTRTQRLADRAAHYLTLAALLVGVGAFLFWLTLGGQTLVFALLTLVSVLVVACPHALGLAIPTVVIISSTLGARAGILIRDNQAVETATRLQAVVFDKTGTLTRGEFGVTDILPAAGVGEEAVLRAAAGVEANSEHTIARGIVQAMQERGSGLPPARDFQAIPGRGAQARVEDARVAVGNRALLDGLGIEAGALGRHVEAWTAEGKTVVYVLREQAVLGLIALADRIRPESYQAVRELKALGLQVAMLTGDHRNVAAYVARELGLDTYFAEVQPDQKAAKVAELQQRGLLVAMVGDGINDAPALVQADVGIAIGAGTQVAIESADVVLVRNDPRAVVSLIRLSQATARKMRQNLLWATGYNVIAIPVAAGVLAPYGIILRPEWSALLMAASSIIVVVNALFLRRTKMTDGAPLPAMPTRKAAHPHVHEQRKAA